MAEGDSLQPMRLEISDGNVQPRKDWQRQRFKHTKAIVKLQGLRVALGRQYTLLERSSCLYRPKFRS
jgi:hypothetical protein